MGARLLRDEAAQRVIDGLLIETTTERNAVAVEAGIWLPGDVVPDEAHNVTTAAATPARPGFIAERRESALTVEYKEFLTASGDTRRQERLRCVVGFSDLLLLPADADHSDGGELVEAKSGGGHHKVREALAQLLDYAPHAKGPLDALTALFPEAPTERDIQWLAQYGIGCAHRAGEGVFASRPAPPDTVERMRPIWQPG